MIQQNTAEWREMRKNYIGGSDAPVVMEVSPWTTPYQLWEEKLDLIPPKKDTFPMSEGRRKEDLARLELEKMTGLFFLPQVKFHCEFQWMMASLDAIDVQNQAIAEIKCPGKEDHGLALQGQIPDKYFPLIQHQLEVCQLEMGYYFSFDGTNNVLLKIYRDDRYIKRLIQKEKDFWDRVQSFNPPELTERDYVKQEGDEWKKLAGQLLLIENKLKEFEILKKEEESIRAHLVLLSQNRNSIGAGVRVTKYMRRGNVDYSSIPELKDVHLDDYRKNSSECWRISTL